MKGLIGTTVLLLVVPIFTSAQSEDHQYRGQGYSFATRPANSSTPATTVMPPPAAVQRHKDARDQEVETNFVSTPA